MAVRFRSDYYSDNGDQWRIEIHDVSHSEGLTLFRTGENGFDLNYRGENQQINNAMLASEVRFDMIVDETNKTEAEQFITDIASAEESRFIVYLYKDLTEFWWAGVVLPDIARIEDEYYPYIFQVVATDGLATLQTAEYSDNGTAYSGHSRLIEVLDKCLKKIPHVETVWSGSTDFIRSIVNWYESNHSPGATYDPLYNTYINERAWFVIDNNGVYKFRKCWDVIKNIMELFGARIMHTEGFWLIEQVETRAEGTFFARKYAYAIAAPSSVTMTGQTNIDPPSNPYRRLNGAHYTFLPPLKTVNVEYRVYNRRNFWPVEQVYNQDYVLVKQIEEIKSNSSAATLRFTGRVSISLKNNTYTLDPLKSIAFVFELMIRVGNRWIRREGIYIGYNITYGPTNWSNSLDYYDVISPFSIIPQEGETKNWQIAIDFTTPVLQEEGDAYVQFRLKTVLDPIQSAFWDLYESDFELNYQLHDAWLEIYNNGTPELNSNIVTYTATNDDVNNSQEVNVITYIGDGTDANSAGRLKFDDGGTFIDTVDWGVSTAGGKELCKLLGERLMRLQKTPRRVLNATIYAGDYMSPYKRLYKDDLGYFLMQGASFNAHRSEWRGEWFLIEITSSGTVSEDDETETDFPVDVEFFVRPRLSLMIASDKITDDAANNPDNKPASLLPLVSALLDGSLEAGAHDTIPVDIVLADGAFVQDEEIALVNPVTGVSDVITVVTTSTDGDEIIYTTGAVLEYDYPDRSYIIKLPKNEVKQNGVTKSLWRDAGDYTYLKDTDDRVLIGSDTEVNTNYTLQIVGDGYFSTGIRIDGELNANGNAGSSGQALTSGGPGNPPTWSNISSSKWTDAGLYTYLTSTGDRVVIGSATELNTGFRLQVSGNSYVSGNLRFNGELNANGFAGTSVQILRSTGSGTPPVWHSPGNIANASGEITVTNGTSQAVSVTGLNVDIRLAQQGATTGQVLQWNGTKWAPATISGGVTGSGSANHIAYWSSGTAITFDNGDLYWNPTSDYLGIGTSSPTAHLHIAVPTASFVTTMYVSGNNSIGQQALFENIFNSSGSGSQELSLKVGGASAGDPYVDFIVGSTIEWSVGVDNSDSDKLKLKPTASPSTGSNTGVTITQDSPTRVGISLDNPVYEIDSASTTRARVLAYFNHSSPPTVAYSSGAGTGASTGSLIGGKNGFFLSFNTGSSPVNNGTICTFTMGTVAPTLWMPTFSPGNATTATNIEKFYISSSGNTGFTVTANGQLSASTTYNLYFTVMAY